MRSDKFCEQAKIDHFPRQVSNPGHFMHLLLQIDQPKDGKYCTN
jgi:hypothetical protein